MRSQWFVLSVIVVVLFGLSSTAHGSLRDQGQIFDTDGELELEANAVWSQSITTGISGQLTEIQIQFHCIFRTIANTIPIDREQCSDSCRTAFRVITNSIPEHPEQKT